MALLKPTPIWDDRGEGEGVRLNAVIAEIGKAKAHQEARRKPTVGKGKTSETYANLG